MTDYQKELAREKEIAAVIRAAGGEFIGRTRLMSLCYLLYLIGDLKTFDFKEVK